MEDISEIASLGTRPVIFENGDLFLRIRFPSTLIRRICVEIQVFEYGLQNVGTMLSVCKRMPCFQIRRKKMSVFVKLLMKSNTNIVQGTT